MKPTPFWKQLRKDIYRCFMLCFIPNGILIFANWYAISPIGYGGTTVLDIGVLFSLITMFIEAIAMITVPIPLIFLAIKRFRKWGKLWILLTIIYGILTFLSLGISNTLRTKGLSRLATRSIPLVQAIKAFETQKGRPPKMLQELIPDFLSSIPKTGMPTYPTYEYLTASNNELSEYLGEQNAWMLYIMTPYGPFYPDVFLYLPSQNYPEQGSGFFVSPYTDMPALGRYITNRARLIPINGWAYADTTID